MTRPVISRMFVLTGPSGVGKTSVIDPVADRLGLVVGVSTTTRQPRPSEIPDVSYHFITNEQFNHVKATGGFLETDSHFAAQYGFEVAEWQHAVNIGKHLIVILDPAGFRQTLTHVPQAVGIFLLPCHVHQLRNRLLSRGASPDELSQRLDRARWELGQVDLYHYVVTNHQGTLAHTVDQVVAIIAAELDGTGAPHSLEDRRAQVSSIAWPA